MAGPADYYINQLTPLVGGQVTSVISDGDGFFGLQIKQVDGKVVNMFIMRDDEGNGPGSFELIEEEA